MQFNSSAMKSKLIKTILDLKTRLQLNTEKKTDRQTNTTVHPKTSQLTEQHISQK